MNREEIRKWLFENLQETFPEKDLSVLGDDDNMIKTLNIESLHFIKVMSKMNKYLKKNFSFKVPQEDQKAFITIRGCLDYLEPKMKEMVPSS